MAARIGWIRQFHKPQQENQPSLLIFPHAGSGASSYRELSKILSATFDVFIVQYPGRQDRAAEPFAHSLPELAQGAYRELEEKNLDDRQWFLFGHSLGAITAFECARLMEEKNHLAALYASASAYPGQVESLPAQASDDDDAILKRMAALNGTGDSVLADLDLLRMILPVMKGDYAAYDRYSCPPSLQLSAPIFALGGIADNLISIDQLAHWEQHTKKFGGVKMFPGGHFYFNENPQQLAQYLATHTTTSLAG